MAKARRSSKPVVPMIPAIALLGALAAASRRMSPTGNEAVDINYALALGAAVTLSGAWCPWWLLATLAATGAALAPSLTVAIAAALGGVLAAAFARRTPIARPGRALATVPLIVAFTRLRTPGFQGGPALVSGIAFTTIVLVGLARGHWRHRGKALWAALGLTLVAGASTAALGIAGLKSKDDLNAAKDAAQRALDQVQYGNFPAARTELSRAARIFGSADQQLDSWMTIPAALVPVISQHRRTLVDLSAAGAGVSSQVERALATIDLDSLKPVAGRIDLAALDKAAGPLEASYDAIAQLDHVLKRTLSDAWIAAPLKRRLQPLATRVHKAANDGETAMLAAKAGRSMLGGSGTRRYLLLFVTPSEARGLGGYAGNFGVIEASDGQLTLTRFGRINELFPSENPSRIVVAGPPGWKDSWARFGGISPTTGTMLRDYWQLITQPPDLRDVGQLAAEIYPQTGGAPIDGLVVLDPQGLGALLRLTGPIAVPSIGRTLDADNAVNFLLRDQYRQFITNDTRVDALEDVARATTTALIGGGANLPNPTEIAKILSPAARGNHLTMWSAHADEQLLLSRVGADNALPDVRGDSLAVTFQNTSGSKLEAFLTRDVDYDVTVDPVSGASKGTVTVTMRNDAPETGLPPYVYGGKPLTGETKFGESQLYVTVYSVYPLTSLVVNGQQAPLLRWAEHGRNAYTAFVDTLAGTTSVLTAQLTGYLPATNDYRLDVRAQTSATTPDRYRIRVHDPQGEVLRTDEPIEGTKTYKARLR